MSRAKRDAGRDMGKPATRCPHPAPYDSVGPIQEGDRSYTVYTCSECGKEMRRHYYR